MNIYKITNPYENTCFFVIAKTRGRAKALATYDLDIGFLEAESNIVRKNIGDEYEEQTIDLGSPLLKKFDLHYYDENGEEIPNE